MQGILSKMQASLASPVEYQLSLSEQLVNLNPLIGEKIQLHYHGNIFCLHCNRKTNKSFNQGYCYPCFKSLAQCDMCIMKPELCHYDAGTCREPEWGEKFCMQPHIVYLANSSGLKVGITRQSQVPTRWIDQGATQALPILKVSSRYLSGLIEVIFARHVSDKTSWQKMLKAQAENIDLMAKRDELLKLCQEDINMLIQRFGESSIEYLKEENLTIEFPIKNYPNKVKSLNLDKQAEVLGILEGIKGQYLILDSGVINLRKFSGYEIEWNVYKI